MSNNTLTIALDGEVTLEEFSQTMAHFTGLVKELSRTVAIGVQIDWVIDDLQAGSAIATIEGYSSQREAIERVVFAYANIGSALANNEPIPYPGKIRDEAIALTNIINGKITSVRFETPRGDAIVYGKYGSTKPNLTVKYAYGTVAGKVETLNSRHGLKFTLYDPIFDKAVTCYLVADQENLMREIWGKRVKVTGRVARTPDRGRPINVRDVKSVRLIEEIAPGSYRAAKGIFPLPENAELPEESLRQVRDAE